VEPNTNGIKAADFYRILREQDQRWEQRLDVRLGETEGRLADRINGLEGKIDRYMEQAGTNRRSEWGVVLSVVSIILSGLVGASSVLLAIVKLGKP